MVTVEDESGRRYILLKRSRESSLVLDIDTGERSYRPNRTLTTIVDSRPPLEEGGWLTEYPHPGARELLSRIDHKDPQRIRDLLANTTLCESELFALIRELELEGVIEQTTIDGEPGVTLTVSENQRNE